MNTARTTGSRRLLAVTLLLVMLCGMMMEAPALAAGLSSKKPVISVKTSSYTNGHVVLKWSKVSGASKYEVYRAKTKGGAYKKFATTTKNSLKKKASGIYYYKVRAVRGSKKGAFSVPVLVFAATAQITNVTFSSSGYVGSYGLLVRVKVRNKSTKAMNFLGMNNCYIYLVNKKTKKVVGSTFANLNTNTDPYGIGVSAGITIPARTTQTLWLHAYDYKLWMTYSDSPSKYCWLATMPFYPGSGSSKAAALGLAAGQKASESSVSVRN